MHIAPRFSVIVPVYNRPDELRELLESLACQTYTNFEVLVVEDGSTVRSEEVVGAYSHRLHIQYLYKPNSGPGPSRNFGFSLARGEYLVVFDSDCIVPPHYFEAVNQALMNEAFDAWGGPDRGHETFTPLQQAMAFTMAAGLTTGGIRGSKRENFQPRSFNMGMSKAVFEKTGGFRFSRLAEDIELSVRIRKAGFKVVLLKQAYVYHKRRTTLTKFFKQVVGFGRGRVRVGKTHPGEVKPVHWLPSLFLAGIISLPLLLLVYPPLFWLGSSLLMVFLITVAVQAYRVTRQSKVALLVIPATFVQLMGYGYGFISEQLKPVSEATSW